MRTILRLIAEFREDFDSLHRVRRYWHEVSLFRNRGKKCHFFRYHVSASSMENFRRAFCTLCQAGVNRREL
jgi:hypothetical protein